jgi:hypothetical protein
MKKLFISRYSVPGRAVMRVLFVLALTVSMIGALPVSPAFADDDTFRLRFTSYQMTTVSGECKIYNEDYPDGLLLDFHMLEDETYAEPATVTCEVEAVAPSGFWTLHDQKFTFHDVPTENSRIDYSKTDWHSGAYHPSDGVEYPTEVGFMEVDIVVDNPGNESRTVSISFIALIAGGFEFTNCAETYTVTTPIVEDWIINPTIESPQGQPWDEQVVALNPPLFEGHEWTYKLETEGGWYDPAEFQDNTKYQVSLDGGLTWQPLYDWDAVVCVDSTGWYFQTDSEEFRIRADDIPLETPSEFEDNLPDEEPFPVYTIYNAEQINPTCAQKFIYDPVADYVTNGILYGDDTGGEFMPPNWTSPADLSLIPGEWYVLETLSGPWYNNGEPSYDIAVDLYDTMWDDQVEFGEWEYTDCWEYTDSTETYKRYFFQAPALAVQLWVHDPAFTFTDNTERISYRLMRVSEYVHWPSECERQFVINDTVSITDISSTAANGIQVATRLPESQWFVLETMEGPWRDIQAGHGGAIYSWDLDIKRATFGVVPDYAYLPEWPDAHCAAKLDPVGHYRVYFQVPVGAISADGVSTDWIYYMRAKGGDDLASYAQHQGGMKVKLSQATLAQVTPPGEDPGEDACDGLYQTNGVLVEANVTPSSSVGSLVPGAMTDGTIYAIETKGYWDEGTGWNTRAQISDNNGATWHDWQDYPGLLCVEVFLEGEKLQYRIFFQKTTGLSLKVRADDTDSNWGNNQNFSYGIRVLNALMLEDPWNSCQDNYALTHIPVPPNTIPATSETGVRLPTVAGQLYAVEIYEGSWKETSSGAAQYDAAISPDSGDTFYEFPDRDMPGFQCYAKIGRYEWIYFTAQDAYTQVRVNGSAGFTDNTGELKFRFYSAVNEGTPGDPVPPPGPPGSYVGCYSSNMRPGTFLLPSMPPRSLSGITGFDDLVDLVTDTLDWIGLAIRYTFENAFNYVGAWMSYMFGSIVSFFLWCPEHTAAIQSILDDMASLEPYATIRRAVEFGQVVQAQVDSYSWSMENGAGVPFSGVSGGVDVPSLISAMDETPFGGAAIEWRPIQGGGTDGLSSCRAHIVYRWGSSNPLVVGYCTVLNIMKMTGINVIVNIGILLSALVLIYNYFRKKWVMDLIGLITGYRMWGQDGGTTKVEIVRK